MRAAAQPTISLAIQRQTIAPVVGAVTIVQKYLLYQRGWDVGSCTDKTWQDPTYSTTRLLLLASVHALGQVSV